MVFLIGLATGLVAINIGRDADDIAKLEAERFAALVNHLQDEATLVGLPMGVELNATENRYRFWELQDKWQRVIGVDVLRERTVPGTVSIDLSLLQDRKQDAEPDGDRQDDPPDAPPKPPSNMILVEPNGLVRQFIARFEGEKLSYNVSLNNTSRPVVGRADRQ